MTRSPFHRPQGFTLVEALIALSVLSLLLGLLYSSLYALGRSVEQSSTHMEGLNEQRLIRQFIRTQFENIVPLSTRNSTDQLTTFFEGYQNEVRYTGQLPSHRGGGGLQFMALRLDQAEKTLDLHYSTAWPDASMNPLQSPASWVTRALLEDTDSISFSYYGQKGSANSPRWHTEWVREPRLPKLIRLEIALDNAPPLPSLVVEIPQSTPDNQPRLVW